MLKQKGSLRALADEVRKLREEVSELRALCVQRQAYSHGSHAVESVESHFTTEHNPSEQLKHEALRAEREKFLSELSKHGHEGSEPMPNSHATKRRQRVTVSTHRHTKANH